MVEIFCQGTVNGVTDTITLNKETRSAVFYTFFFLFLRSLLWFYSVTLLDFEQTCRQYLWTCFECVCRRFLCCDNTKHRRTDFRKTLKLNGTMIVSSEKRFSKRRPIDVDFMHPFLIRSRRSVSERRACGQLVWLIDSSSTDRFTLDAGAVLSASRLALRLSSAKTASCVSLQFVIARRPVIRLLPLQLIRVRIISPAVVWRLVDIRPRRLLTSQPDRRKINL